MFCKQCGTERAGEQKFCTACGTSFVKDSEPAAPKPPTQFPKQNNVEWGKAIPAIVVVLLIGWGIYASLDDDAIEQNNDALSSLESGNSSQAISQFQQASESAITDETKLNTQINLAYALISEGRNDEALATFQEAQSLASSGSADYYLVSGEIALLQGKPNAAYISLNKAYEIDPENFQVNNSLALFLLDLEEIAPAYANYPQALVHAKKAYSANPSTITIQNLGVAHFYNENNTEAISFLSQINLDQHPYTSLWLGLAYAGNNDVANAKFYFRKAIASGVDVPQEIYDYLNSN